MNFIKLSSWCKQKQHINCLIIEISLGTIENHCKNGQNHGVFLKKSPKSLKNHGKKTATNGSKQS